MCNGPKKLILMEYNLLIIISITIIVLILFSIGGGTGIGRAICRVMAREGASVAVTGIELWPLQETAAMLKDVAAQNGHTKSLFKAFKMDVSSSEQVDSVMGSLAREFGEATPLSAVVNNAGILRDALMLKMSESMFDDVLRVNLKVTHLSHQNNSHNSPFIIIPIHM